MTARGGGVKTSAAKRHVSHAWRRGVCTRCRVRVTHPAAQSLCEAHGRVKPRRFDDWHAVGRANSPGAPELYEWAGRRMTIAQIAQEMGVSKRTLYQRKARGWSLERAATTAEQPRDLGDAQATSAHLDGATYDRLARLAKLRRTSVSALVRAAVASWLRTRVDEDPHRTPESGRSPVEAEPQIRIGDPVAANTAENARSAGLGRIRG